MQSNQNVYNIPFTESFLDVVAKQLLLEIQGNQESLAHYLLLLPNARTIKHLQDSFLKNSNSKALILPKMISMNNLDYVLSSYDFINNNAFKGSKSIFNDIFKQSISKRKREFILAKLIQKKEHKLSINQAILMAQSLGEIIDDSYFENVNFKNLENIVDSNLAHHWQESLTFLKIATESYPKILEELQAIDIACKQNLIYKLQDMLWQQNPPQHPVIALNINSYYPNVIGLLKTITSFKQGRVVFSGIDFNLDNKIQYQHPQKNTEYILNKLKIDKAKIESFDNNPKINKKEIMIHHLFDNTIYKNFKKSDIKKNSENLTLLVAKNEEEEAKQIALLIRESLENKEQTIGIISNNNIVITRLKTELKRWKLEVNNYLGEPLGDSLNAKFFILVGRIIAEGFEPNLFLSLLKNPLSQFSKDRKDILVIAELLDLKIFRQAIKEYSLNYFINLCQETTKLHYDFNTNQKLKQKIITFLKDFKNLTQEIEPILKNPERKYNFKDLLILHIKLAEKIALSFTNKVEENDLWSEQAGKQLAMILSELLEESDFLDELSFLEYLGIIENILAKATIQQVYNKHPRIYIYGNLQSTLIHHDIMILAGLNDTKMPRLKEANPWLNKYMSLSLGFLPKEKELGEQANIFCQNLGANQIVLSRAENEEGTLSAPSRWLLRLETLLSYYKIKNIATRKDIIEIAQSLDYPNSYDTNVIQKPEYNPDIATRPSKLAVTTLEKLLQNPYVFFIDRILKLKVLDDINPNMSHLIYGEQMHLVLEDFFTDLKANQKLSLEDQSTVLAKLFHKRFSGIDNSIKFHIFTKPIALNSLENFAKYNYEYFSKIKNTFLEEDGQIIFPLENINLTITGKADRIDILDSEITIIDYKTSKQNVKDFQKQVFVLPMILKNNGFSLINFNNENIESKYVFLEKKYNSKIKESTMQTVYKSQAKKLQKKENQEIQAKDKNKTLAYSNDSLDRDKNFSNIDIINNYEDELRDILSFYYEKQGSYSWSSEKFVDDAYLHFARFDEWNNNIESILEEENDEEDGEYEE